MKLFEDGAIATREDWETVRDHRPPPRPRLLSLREYKAMDEDAREDYDEERADWHADFGISSTPVMAEAMRDFMLRGRFNYRNVDPVKAHVVLSGPPTLGKTTISRALGRRYDQWLRKRLKKRGIALDGEEEVCLVVYVSLTSETTTRSLNEQIAHFLGATLPNNRPTWGLNMEIVVSELLRRHNVRLLILDDLHLLRAGDTNAELVRDYLKALTSRAPVMLLLVGIDLQKTNLFEDPPALKRPAAGRSNKSGQMGGRSGLVEVTRFEKGSKPWQELVGWIEDQLVLLKHERGTLRGLHNYLWDRTQGGIGSLMLLVRLAADLAVETRYEKLDQRLLDKVKLDYNAEKNAPKAPSAKAQAEGGDAA